ncbi:MAG: nucleotidyl transferase AbiEii/AbiGii toxin family protein [Rhodocyclaceae bacterium]|nr:nucleotidyl transferase AbiEii/AbiGii toxin family protein [Rhodocyclaceae bacterium]
MQAIDWSQWIKDGGASNRLPLRQAVHIVLIAASNCPSIRDTMMMKGGILMALSYSSTRYTKDIDFSTGDAYSTGAETKIVEELRAALPDAVESTDYGVDCRIQNFQLKPPSESMPTFPTLKVKVGYARQTDRSAYQRLQKGKSPEVVEIDFSFNESTQSAIDFEILSGGVLKRYSLTDLVAEKYRALLQQVSRERNRRQDVYDLHLLISSSREILNESRTDILNALVASARSKGLRVDQNSLSEDEIRKRSMAEYDQLQREIQGTLPPFDEAFETVEEFYRSLDWTTIESA